METFYRAFNKVYSFISGKSHLMIGSKVYPIICVTPSSQEQLVVVYEDRGQYFSTVASRDGDDFESNLEEVTSHAFPLIYERVQVEYGSLDVWFHERNQLITIQVSGMHYYFNSDMSCQIDLVDINLYRVVDQDKILGYTVLPQRSRSCFP